MTFVFSSTLSSTNIRCLSSATLIALSFSFVASLAALADVEQIPVDTQVKTASLQSNELLQSEVQVTVEVQSSLFNRLPILETAEQIKAGKTKSLSKRAKTTAVSLANFVFDARGFDFSKEGADLVLGQHKLKGDSAKEYLACVWKDKKELATIQCIMQLASCIDKDSAKADKAKADLEILLGSEAAQKVYAEVANLPAADLPANREKLSWDLDDRRDKLTAILEKSALNDKALQKVTERLAKYNHRSKTMQIVAKVAYTGLGIASFAPTLVAPIAETSLLAFMYATGGPEQDKLLKELYLSKMMQSRCDLTNEKAHMVVGSLDLALLTNNKRLFAWSKELLCSMTDKEMAEQMFSADRVASAGKMQELH